MCGVVGDAVVEYPGKILQTAGAAAAKLVVDYEEPVGEAREGRRDVWVLRARARSACWWRRKKGLLGAHDPGADYGAVAEFLSDVEPAGVGSDVGAAVGGVDPGLRILEISLSVMVILELRDVYLDNGIGVHVRIVWRECLLHRMRSTGSRSDSIAVQ